MLALYRKVLAPRIWRLGYIRTKFTEQLNMYIALANHFAAGLLAEADLDLRYFRGLGSV